MEKRLASGMAGKLRSTGSKLRSTGGLKQSESKLKKASGLKAKSPALAKREALYKGTVAYWRQLRPCRSCCKCHRQFLSVELDPHHPWGRQRLLTIDEIKQFPHYTELSGPPALLDMDTFKYISLYLFVFICRDCHTFIHDNPKLGEEQGWIIP